MAKLSAPNPAIFTTDPIESVFAKGVANRDNTAGLNASWLLAFGNDRAANQDKYMGSLREANAMDAQLAQQEAALKLREQGMKSATDLIKEGFMPSSLHAGGDLFSDVGGGDTVSKMLQALIQSKIAANYNKGAGGGSKETTTVQQIMTPWGAPGPTTVTSKSPNAANAYGANSAAVAKVVADMKVNPQNYSEGQKKQIINMMLMPGNPRGQTNVEE